MFRYRRENLRIGSRRAAVGCRVFATFMLLAVDSIAGLAGILEDELDVTTLASTVAHARTRRPASTSRRTR